MSRTRCHAAPRAAAKRLAVESLESKTLLAGDVAASVIDGVLVLEGDAEANHVVVSAGEAPGSYVVTGLPSSDGEATTIRGGSEPLVVEGVDAGARISLGGGDDALRIHRATFAGDVQIRLGAGDDAVGIGGRHRLVADSGDADDARFRPNVGVRGDLRIGTGAGDDRVAIGGVRLGGDLVVQTGAGDDAVHVGFRHTPLPPEMDTPEGESDRPPAPAGDDDADRLAAPNAVDGRILISTGRGDDQAVVESLRSAAGLKVRTSGGDDVVRIEGARVHGGLSVHSGGGNDRVGLGRVAAEAAYLALGAGDDDVGVGNSTFGRLMIRAGAGDDEALIRDVAARSARLHGGPGEDSLTTAGENHFGRLVATGFESIS